MPRSCRGCLVVIAAVLALVLVAFLTRLLWLPLPARFLVVEDPLQPAQALVPLAGGEQRAVYAAQLFEAGYADWFVATDMPLNIPGIRATYGELVRQDAIAHGVPEDRILIAPGLVETTYDEALALRALAQERGWQSILVVTDPYHTHRARLTFRHAFRGTGVTVAIHPVQPAAYDPQAWWRTVDGLRDTWTEWLKLGMYVLGYR